MYSIPLLPTTYPTFPILLTFIFYVAPHFLALPLFVPLVLPVPISAIVPCDTMPLFCHLCHAPHSVYTPCSYLLPCHYTWCMPSYAPLTATHYTHAVRTRCRATRALPRGRRTLLPALHAVLPPHDAPRTARSYGFMDVTVYAVERDDVISWMMVQFLVDVYVAFSTFAHARGSDVTGLHFVVAVCYAQHTVATPFCARLRTFS